MAAPIEKRDIAKCIILSIVTCGIYGLYWLYKMGEEIAGLRQDMPDGGRLILLSFVTCSVYLFWWIYMAGDVLNASKQQRLGVPSDPNKGVIYLVLALCGLAIVSYALMQQDLNMLADADAGGDFGSGAVVGGMDFTA